MESEIKVKKPVKINQKLWVKIDSVGKLNDGVVKYGDSGFIIFVKDGKISKEYYVQIEKITKHVAFARIIKEGLTK